jgi:hypothetical protein
VLSQVIARNVDFIGTNATSTLVSPDAIADRPTTDYGFVTTDAGSQIRAGGLSRREKTMRHGSQ